MLKDLYDAIFERKPKTLEVGSKRFAILNVNGEEVIEQYVDNDQMPDHIDSKVNITTHGGFSHYIKRYSAPDSSLIGVKRTTGFGYSATATLDYHGNATEPDRCRHQAFLNIPASLEFEKVSCCLGLYLSQKDAVEYLDSIMEFITRPEADHDAPTAAEMMKVVRSLSVISKKQATVETNEAGDTEKLVYEESNKPSIELPQYFVVAVKVYDEADLQGIKIKMTARADENGMPQFKFFSSTLDQVVRDEKDKITEAIKAELSDFYVYDIQS